MEVILQWYVFNFIDYLLQGFINPSYGPCASGCVNDYSTTVRMMPLRDPVNNNQFVAASEGIVVFS